MPTSTIESDTDCWRQPAAAPSRGIQGRPLDQRTPLYHPRTCGAHAARLSDSRQRERVSCLCQPPAEALCRLPPACRRRPARSRARPCTCALRTGAQNKTPGNRVARRERLSPDLQDEEQECSKHSPCCHGRCVPTIPSAIAVARFVPPYLVEANHMCTTSPRPLPCCGRRGGPCARLCPWHTVCFCTAYCLCCAVLCCAVLSCAAPTLLSLRRRRWR